MLTLPITLGLPVPLQQQIENGAPADIFVSAAQKQMDALESKILSSRILVATF
jgi:molybdate transport system substrate-binding protein